MNFLNKILLLMILLLVRKKLIGMCIPQTPCPNVFLYKYQNNRWYGELSILVPDVNERQLFLVVSYFSSQIITEDFKNSLQVLDTPEQISINIQNRRPVKYVLLFPFPNNPPDIDEIKLNGILLCSGTQGQDAIALYTRENFLAVQQQTILVGPNGKPIPDRRPSVPISRPPVQTPRPPVQTPRPPIQTPRPPVQTPRPYVPPARPQGQFGRPVPSGNRNDLEDRLFDPTDSEGHCGVIKKNYVAIPLVVNGVPAEKQPWLVALFDTDQKGPKFFCAGSLISKRFVVTAAHCTFDKKTIILKLGDNNVASITSQVGKIFISEEIINHPEYRPNSGSSSNADIAIIKMNSAVEFSNNIKPVCLWPNQQLEENLILHKEASIYGWGNDETGRLSTEAPKRTTLIIRAYDECKRMDLLRNVISDKTICATGSQPGSGPCLGDSGGGLYMRVSGKWTIRGVISTAIGLEGTNTCDVVNYFSVYTDTGKYYNWISETFNKYK